MVAGPRWKASLYEAAWKRTAGIARFDSVPAPSVCADAPDVR